MARGKETCRILKEIRRQIAEANDIEFITSECKYKGDCLGTCPKCEAEVRYLEQQLRARRLAGKAVALAGISAGVIMLSGCGGTPSNKPIQTTDDTIEVAKSNDLQGKQPIEMSDSSIYKNGEVSGDEGVLRVMTKFVPPKSDSKRKKEKTSANKQEAIPTQGEVTDSTIYTLAGDIEAMPEFPGGTAKMMEFLAANVKWPESLNDGPDVQGRVVVAFTVEKDGSINDIEVVRSVYPDLDEEAVRVVKLFPKFIPATHNGKTVRCIYTLPINFRLQ